MHAAVTRGRVAVVQYLAEQGADKDKANDDGVTPLYGATQYGHFTVVQFLAEQGADKEKADDDGFTPVLVACLNGQVGTC